MSGLSATESDPEPTAMPCFHQTPTLTNQLFAVLPACVRNPLTRTMVADDAHSDRNQVAQSSSALHTLPAGQAVREMPAKTYGRHTTLVSPYDVSACLYGYLVIAIQIVGERNVV